MKAGLSILLAIFLSAQCCAAGRVRTITLTGRVIDYRAQPVAGATVICYEPEGRTSTGPDGQFSFKLAAKEGFSPRVVAGKEGLALGWCHYIHNSELTPTIRLGKPSLFKGTVVDEAGRPVPGASVRMCLRNRMMAEYTEIAPLVPES